MTIKRYGTSSAECSNGIYVLFSEYERVVAECERLRADAERWQLVRELPGINRFLIGVIADVVVEPTK
jgi:hypothetical protein